MKSYDFKTVQLHIDFMAAVNNFYNVEDDDQKRNLLHKLKMYRAVLAKTDYNQITPYFSLDSRMS